MTTPTHAFQPGTTYEGTFITNSDSVFRYVVERRTAKTVWLRDPRDGETVSRRIKVKESNKWNRETGEVVRYTTEYCEPMGRYSMAPLLCADSPAKGERVDPHEKANEARAQLQQSPVAARNAASALRRMGKADSELQGELVGRGWHPAAVRSALTELGVEVQRPALRLVS